MSLATPIENDSTFLLFHFHILRLWTKMGNNFIRFYFERYNFKRRYNFKHYNFKQRYNFKRYNFNEFDRRLWIDLIAEKSMESNQHKLNWVKYLPMVVCFYAQANFATSLAASKNYPHFKSGRKRQ